MLIILYTPLCWVRKIETLAATHVFADAMILITICTLWVYAGIRIADKGFADDVPAVNSHSFLDAIGSMVYSYEGVGVILPVYEVTKNPEKMPKILGWVLTTVLIVYIAFGMLLLMVYGSALKDSPIITETITHLEPAGKIDYVILVIKICFSFNLLFSYPLVIYPANIILEDNVYKGWPKS